MLREDLPEGIPFVDESGRRADLHALRNAFATGLGADPQVTAYDQRDLMRHSTVQMSSHYTDTELAKLAAALERSPDVGRVLDDENQTLEGANDR